LEKKKVAGVKMVEDFGRNIHLWGNQGRQGGYRDKKSQGAAKWIHCDAICLTQHMLRESVANVEANLDSISTRSTLTASTVQTRVADSMATDPNMTPLDDENMGDTTGKMTGNITSNTPGTTSGASTPSPLTMIEFSDIESDNEEREIVSNKRKKSSLCEVTKTRWMSKRRRTIMPIWMESFERVAWSHR
jgi:hypothetical protein